MVQIWSCLSETKLVHLPSKCWLSNLQSWLHLLFWLIRFISVGSAITQKLLTNCEKTQIENMLKSTVIETIISWMTFLGTGIKFVFSTVEDDTTEATCFYALTKQTDIKSQAGTNVCTFPSTSQHYSCSQMSVCNSLIARETPGDDCPSDTSVSLISSVRKLGCCFSHRFSFVQQVVLQIMLKSWTAGRL